MALVTDAFTTYTAVGKAEDVINKIAIVTQLKVPGVAAIGRVPALAKIHQWQTDVIGTPVSTGKLEGDVFAATAVTPTVQLINYTMIQSIAVQITRTEQKVRKYGRANEMAYQLMKIGEQLQLQTEKCLFGVNRGYTAGAAATIPLAASILAYLVTNVDKASDGSNPAGTGADARTDGTVRPLTQTLFNNVMVKCAESGAEPSLVLASPFNMQRIQTFDNNQTKFQSVDGTLKGIIEYVQTPFGVVGCRYDNQLRSAYNSSTTSELIVLDPNFVNLAELDPIHIQDFAKTGDTVDPKAMVHEFTLEVMNEKACGLVADLAVS